MITINNRNELVEFLYGENSNSPETLVGIARIGGELLDEALGNEYAPGHFSIDNFSLAVTKVKKLSLLS